jgi:hypothetical protein
MGHGIKAEVLLNKMHFLDLKNTESCPSYSKSKVAHRRSEQHERRQFGDLERLFRFVTDIEETRIAYHLKVQSTLNTTYASDETYMQIRQRFSGLKVLIRRFSTVAGPYFERDFRQIKVF